VKYWIKKTSWSKDYWYLQDMIWVWNDIDFDKGKSKDIFESLQEKKSMNDYKDILDKLICMYIQMINLKNQFEENEYKLMII